MSNVKSMLKVHTQNLLYHIGNCLLSPLIVTGWSQKYPDEPLFKPIETIDKLVREGKLGRKTGKGFYKYSK